MAKAKTYTLTALRASVRHGEGADRRIALMRRGDALPADTDPADLERLVRLGRAVIEGKEAKADDAPAAFDAASATDDELLKHLSEGGKDGKPLTVPQTVALWGDDSALADRVLAAEASAHGDPREGVVKAHGKLAEGAKGDE